jgi:hypothetical protein
LKLFAFKELIVQKVGSKHSNDLTTNKKITVEGLIPVNDSVNILAIVTAGFAKLVDDVNIRAALI